jgi:hypothetical protein
VSSRGRRRPAPEAAVRGRRVSGAWSQRLPSSRDSSPDRSSPFFERFLQTKCFQEINGEKAKRELCKQEINWGLSLSFYTNHDPTVFFLVLITTSCVKRHKWMDWTLLM